MIEYLSSNHSSNHIDNGLEVENFEKTLQQNSLETSSPHEFKRTNTYTLGRHRKREVEKINMKLRNVITEYERKGYLYIFVSLFLLLPTIILLFLKVDLDNIKYHP